MNKEAFAKGIADPLAKGIAELSSTLRATTESFGKSLLKLGTKIADVEKMVVTDRSSVDNMSNLVKGLTDKSSKDRVVRFTELPEIVVAGAKKVTEPTEERLGDLVNEVDHVENRVADVEGRLSVAQDTLASMIDDRSDERVVRRSEVAPMVAASVESAAAPIQAQVDELRRERNMEGRLRAMELSAASGGKVVIQGTGGGTGGDPGRAAHTRRAVDRRIAALS